MKTENQKTALSAKEIKNFLEGKAWIPLQENPQSQAESNAINSTYLSGLDPLAYGEVVEALQNLVAANDGNGKSVYEQMLKAKISIEKAIIK